MNYQNKLQSPKWNMAAIALIAIGSFFVWINSGIMEGAGMAAIILVWLPFIIGILTVIVYFISRLFTKKWNWVASLLGILLMLGMVVSSLVNG